MTPSEQLENDRLAHAVCTRREASGQRFEPGTFVAIAEGRVVGVGNSFEEADEQLGKSGVRPGEGLVCQVAAPIIDVIR